MRLEASIQPDSQNPRQQSYSWSEPGVSQYCGRPGDSVLARIPVLDKEIDTSNAAFQAIIGKDLSDVNAKLAGNKLEPINVMTKEEYDKKQEK